MTQFSQPAQPSRVASDKPAAFAKGSTRIGVVFARRITYRHNDATGANFYELTANTDPANVTDPRSIIIDDIGSDIFQSIVEADSRVDDLFRDESRDLYPRLEITPGERIIIHSKAKAQYYHVKAWKAMPMSSLEQTQRDIIRKFDRLHDIGKEYGLGRQARIDIIRKWQQRNMSDFAFQAEVDLRCSKFIGTYDLDYEPEYDTNVYPRDTEVINMTMGDIAQKARDKQANEELQQTLETTASADLTPDPDTAPTRSELDKWFGDKAPGEVTTLTDDEMKESLRMKYREGLGRDMTVADFERATEWKRLEDARYADKGALTDAEIMKMVEADIAAQKKIAQEAPKNVEIEVKAIEIPETPNAQVVATPASVEKSKPRQSVALVPTGDSKWDVMTQKAQVMIRSGFMPEAIKTADQVLTIAMMGEALDIDPIVAVNNINVIKGKPTVSPQLMLALVRRSKQLEDFSVVDDGSTCTVTMKRKGETTHIEKFSMEDAQRMKTTEWENNTKKTISLSEKHNWRQQPAVMRKWRAISAACRVVFPDIIWGLYTTEEIDPDTIVVEAA